ncbi:olfactory receptor 5J3-like [Kogia breviceps]|uniref:olfactory receptor 5J3-like n=1 Tax=Kogia breviceps TaxID=27615 RepID=UPI002795A97C|nr:olfactory receptor 1052-like [Kogia breviceps]
MGKRYRSLRENIQAPIWSAGTLLRSSLSINDLAFKLLSHNLHFSKGCSRDEQNGSFYPVRCNAPKIIKFGGSVLQYFPKMAINVTLMEQQPKAGSHHFGGAEGQQALAYRLLEDNLFFSSRVSLVAHKNMEASVVKAKTCSGPMGAGNASELSEFFLVGFTNELQLQPILLALFFLIYAVTVVGNLGLLVLIVVSSRLHTPMYFFFSNLSFIDFCYSSITVPKMLMGFFSGCQTISFSGCVVQTSCCVIFAVTEFFLLATMAYDHYVAICSPLLYHIIKVLQVLLFVSGGFNVSVSLTVVLVSYTCVFMAIIRIPSAQGKHKTFSTCAFHLTDVSLYYGTTVFIYLCPTSEYLLGRERLVSVFYTVVIPMLNPMIYSLRNKDTKETFGNVLKKTSQFFPLPIPRFP